VDLYIYTYKYIHLQRESAKRRRRGDEGEITSASPELKKEKEE